MPAHRAVPQPEGADRGAAVSDPSEVNDQQTVRCLRCDVPLVYSAERHLVDEYIVSMRHWLHVIVLECPSCGHLELFNPDRAQYEKQDKEEEDVTSPRPDTTLLNFGIRPGGEDLPPEDPNA